MHAVQLVTMKRMEQAARSGSNAPGASRECGRPGRWFTLVLLIGAVVAGIYEGGEASRRAREVRRLRDQVRELRAERDQALRQLGNVSQASTSRMTMAAEAATNGQTLPAGGQLATNLYARLKDHPPKLTDGQVEAYLAVYGRQASGLLAGYRTSGNPLLLKEAMANFPNDPQVAFEAVFAPDLSPEQRRQWLEAFKQNAPDNALANYLSARDYLKAGQTDQAVQELLAAAAKGVFQDYTLSRRQDDEEAYLAAGYPTAQAKMIGSGQVELPQLAELKNLGLQMVDVAGAYRQAGDDASAQTVLEMAVGLGDRYSSADCAISHLVGLAIERNALAAMTPGSVFGNSGQTAQELLDLLTQQKTAINTLFRDDDSLFEAMTDQDWINYIDRDKSFGEESARRWLQAKYGHN